MYQISRDRMSALVLLILLQTMQRYELAVSHHKLGKVHSCGS